MKLPKVSGLVLVAVVSAVMGLAQDRQQARARIDVQTVALDAQINPTAQTLSATAKITFIPLDNTSTVTFELNNALNLTRVTDLEGRQITASRFGEDMSVRLSLPQPLPKGQPATQATETLAVPIHVGPSGGRVNGLVPSKIFINH